jgi:beta-N-acetylhexosaminidase
MKKVIFLVSVFLCINSFARAEEIIPVPQVPLADKIDQMIMIGFRGMDVGKNSDIEKILHDSNVGGVILFDYDTATKTYNRNIKNKKQLQLLTSELQSSARTKLFVALDQEGGLVNRLKPVYGFAVFNSAQVLAGKGYAFASQQYMVLAQTLSDVGINVNFGPVLDVTSNMQSTIYKQKRIYSKNPIVVTNYARIFIDALQSRKILTTGKHYPGLGDLVFDTHQTLGSLEKVNPQALVPYRQLIKENKLQSIMMGHVVVKDIDPIYPASLSQKHIDYVRTTLGFNGIIFTDDLEMKGMTSLYNLEERVRLAVNAGNTVLILSNNMGTYDPDLFFKVRTIIQDGVKNGTIDKAKIDDAYKRITEAKQNF